MQCPTIQQRRLAMALGVISAGGALYILLKDDIIAWRWSDAFVLVPVMMTIALAAGHLTVTAFRNRRVLAGFGFALAFGLGTLLTVYTSVGKQGDTLDTRVYQSEDRDAARGRLKADLDRARQRHRDAEAQVDTETSDRRCGQRCQDWKLRAREVKANIRELERQLADMTRTPVAADAERFAKVLHVLVGTNEGYVRAILILLKPFAFAILFEITAIAALGFAFGSAAPQTDKVKVIEVPVPVSPTPPGSKRNPMIEAWVQGFEKQHGRKPRLPEIRQRFPDVGKTTAWRYGSGKHAA